MRDVQLGWVVCVAAFIACFWIGWWALLPSAVGAFLIAWGD